LLLELALRAALACAQGRLGLRCKLADGRGIEEYTRERSIGVAQQLELI